MSYEQKDGRGILFKNRDKREVNHSDWNGELRLDGKDFWLNGYVKKDRNGNDYISITTKPKLPKAQKPKPVSYGSKNDMDDEIPF